MVRVELTQMRLVKKKSIKKKEKKTEVKTENLRIPKSNEVKPEIKKVKGKGLMLGLEFDFEVGPLRKTLIYDKKIFTGGSSNKNLLRILPPLTVQKKHIDYFFTSLKAALKEHSN